MHPNIDDAKAQMQKELNQYKNDSKPYDFESPGVYKSIEKAFEKDKAKPKEDPKPVYMMNVMGNWRKMPQPKPKPASKENQSPKKEGKQANEPIGKDDLREKSTRNSWLESIGNGASVRVRTGRGKSGI